MVYRVIECVGDVGCTSSFELRAVMEPVRNADVYGYLGANAGGRIHFVVTQYRSRVRRDAGRGRGGRSTSPPHVAPLAASTRLISQSTSSSEVTVFHPDGSIIQPPA